MDVMPSVGALSTWFPWLERHTPDAVGDIEYNLCIHEVNCKSHWRTHTPAHHIWKALKHLFWYAMGNGFEPHLTHAATRLLFALQLVYEANPGRFGTQTPGTHYGVGRHG